MGRKLLLGLFLLSPLGLFPILRNADAPIPYYPVPADDPLTPDQKLVLGCLSILPGQSFPAAIPWEPFRKIGQQESRALEELAENNPVEFLERCIHRYEKEVHSYRLTFVKQEKVFEKLRRKEKIRIHFREKPFSVHMDWIEGSDKAIKSLYVEGENRGMLQVRPFSRFLPVVSVKTDDFDAKATSRFPITKFGMYLGAKNTLEAMREAEKNGTLYITYEGIHRLKETGNRPCYKFIRSPYTPPEEDGVNELTVYIDIVTLLQVGSVLHDEQGNLIAEYFFRDIELNPTFDAKQFTAKAL